MTRRLPLVFVLVGALSVAPGAVGAKPLTVAQFRTQANAACNNAYKEIAGLSRSSLAVYIAHALPITRSFQALVARLDEPSVFAAPFAKLISTLTAESAQLQKLYARARAGSLTIPQFQNDETMSALSRTENSLWSKMGVSVCAS